MSQQFLPNILAAKTEEVAQLLEEQVGNLRETYRFYDYLKNHSDRLQVIAEIKKASPSLGDINLEVDILAQARAYESAGAAMISVLTDAVFFKGDIADLRAVSDQVNIPTLAKDFIIDEKQIIRSLNAGATVILLIVAALSEERLGQLYQYATQLGLEVLVETHNLEELQIAHRIGAQIIGINNRNLTTFETDLNTSLTLADHFIDGPVYISESAILSENEARQVAPAFSGILVGTALMQAASPAQRLKELRIDKG
ncbi:indole-3-glycerol phosphate synthase TrpC [Streptococcus rifensis]